jgi:hypothetical protein
MLGTDRVLLFGRVVRVFVFKPVPGSTLEQCYLFLVLLPGNRISPESFHGIVSLLPK